MSSSQALEEKASRLESEVTRLENIVKDLTERLEKAVHYQKPVFTNEDNGNIDELKTDIIELNAQIEKVL